MYTVWLQQHRVHPTTEGLLELASYPLSDAGAQDELRSLETRHRIVYVARTVDAVALVLAVDRCATQSGACMPSPGAHNSSVLSRLTLARVIACIVLRKPATTGQAVVVHPPRT